MNNLSDVSQKIEKLIRLSQSSNIHEAELAMQKAKQIAIEHDLDLSQLEVTAMQDTKEDFTQETIEEKGKSSCISIYIEDILRKHFKVRILTRRIRYSKTVKIAVGRKSDIHAATYIKNYLEMTFMRLWKSYKKLNNLTVRDKTTYIKGLWKGLDSKLTEIEKETVSKKSEDIQNKYAIIVKNEIQLLNSAVNKFFPSIGNTKVYHRNNGSSDTFNAGFNSGKQIELNSALTSNNNSLLCQA